MQPEFFHTAGKVLEVSSGKGVLVELQDDITIGEIIRFPHPSEPSMGEQVITRLENREGEIVYRARGGERVILYTTATLLPGDIIDKLQTRDCLGIEATVSPQDICFLNGIIEGYDNMAVLRTLDSSRGLVEILASPYFRDEIRAALHSLRSEMPHQVRPEAFHQ
ncbi:MAG: DUF4911 domain-containing protein [bacterium]